MNTIEFNNVWKKFKKGEKFNSLRDTIPNFFKGLFLKNDNSIGTLEDKEFWAVKDVNFHIKKGEVVGIIGPNGAGKSTVLKILSGIHIPNKGDMRIYGRLSALIEVTAGFHPELTGRENVYLNGTILGMKKKEIDERLEDIIEFSGIREFIDTPVKRYSSGMFSRLGFSVAAHINPDVLLVDEVLSVGDIAFQAKCAQKMRELLKSNVTIVIVSHNLPLIQNLCQRVILINKGEVTKEGSPNEVIPFYENIVFQQTEEELKRKLINADFKVKVKDQSLVDIKEVQFIDAQRSSRKSFQVGEQIGISVVYESRKKIESPVFMLEIMRPDGVLCCSSSTKENHFNIADVDGHGKIHIDLGRINLAPGMYIIKLSVWDKDLIHPYVIRNNDVLTIAVDGAHKQSDAVFLPEVEWKV